MRGWCGAAPGPFELSRRKISGSQMGSLGLTANLGPRPAVTLQTPRHVEGSWPVLDSVAADLAPLSRSRDSAAHRRHARERASLEPPLSRKDPMSVSLEVTSPFGVAR